MSLVATKHPAGLQNDICGLRTFNINLKHNWPLLVIFWLHFVSIIYPKGQKPIIVMENIPGGEFGLLNLFHTGAIILNAIYLIFFATSASKF